MKKKRKVELITVDNFDHSMKDGKYCVKEYHGNVVLDNNGNGYCYITADGSVCTWITEEIANLIIKGEHTTLEVVGKDDIPKPEAYISSGVISLIDMIGDTPKKLNIEF
jgi:hypothetical protein